MSNPAQYDDSKTTRTEQEILANSFDKDFNILAVEVVGHNPTTNTLERLQADGSGALSVGNVAYDTYIATDSGDTNVTYIGTATPGTATSAASWQIKKVDETSGTVIKYADGNANFDNVWDNRESLSY